MDPQATPIPELPGSEIPTYIIFEIIRILLEVFAAIGKAIS